MGDSVRKGKQVIRDRDRVAPSRTIDNATFVFSQSKEPQYEYYYEDQYDSSEPQDMARSIIMSILMIMVTNRPMNTTTSIRMTKMNLETISIMNTKKIPILI